MTPKRTLNRRSFLARVSGGALMGAGLASAAGAQTGPYTGVTDSDSGSHADSAGHGRGPGGNRYGQPAQPQQNHTGCSDSDGGNTADPSGAGRRCGPGRQSTGITDTDPTDSYGQGQGRQGVRPNLRRPDGCLVHHTGQTDADSGQSRDPANYGNGGRRGSNTLYHGGSC